MLNNAGVIEDNVAEVSDLDQWVCAFVGSDCLDVKVQMHTMVPHPVQSSPAPFFPGPSPYGHSDAPSLQ